MAKATYYFANGTAALVAVPVTVDKNGDLTHAESGQVVVTGAKQSELPESGCYVIDAVAAEAAAAKAKAEAAAKAQAEADAKAEAEAKSKAEAAAAKGKPAAEKKDS